ncbi:hypothetical protein [Virgibacillus pantothenticus]|uniref:Uncharacterized protein n=2 Tax=Virgibacillus pantothenticus TaxID=1473 RepID=A0A0L0QV50_VIRPA|nr:hypothetical protein [Virgibacillus pantothenticus]KNE22451.1 hypothetical protein AFK71_02185 [Virgibacillus pantothenticus]MED3739381.1 hypothetical protein [Virgibacillus pantothenticus]QTY16910.1 hypothetical protein KBP50_03025 [Virgibacillus pantothenticus]SIS85510.1 hypothetical protein SAMN05421787_1054 [Virgibacillus pantothenticus]
MIEHPDITHIRRTGYPKYKGEVKMLDSLEISGLLNDISEKTKELEIIYRESDFFIEELADVAQALSDDIDTLISRLQD